MAEAETARVGQQGNAHRAALRDQADIAGEAGGILQLLHIG